MIRFITGNKGKFAEAKAILGDKVEQLNIDLPEIQGLDLHEITKAKLEAAFDHHDGEMMVEDGGVFLDALNGFPGPLIKWMWQSLGAQKTYELCRKLGNFGCVVKVIVAFARNRDDIAFFEGELRGTIVEPRGSDGFAWDCVFVPDGYNKTLAEMTMEEKNSFSYRRQALDKLKEYINK